MRSIATKAGKFILLLTGLLILSIVGWRLIGPIYTAKVTLINVGTSPLERVQVEVCGETGNTMGIEPNQSKVVTLKIPRDCHYVVDATFRSGAKVHGEVGYVTPGLNTEDELKISEDRVELGKTSAK